MLRDDIADLLEIAAEQGVEAALAELDAREAALLDRMFVEDMGQCG